MKTYRGVKIKLHTFLNLTQDEGKFHALAALPQGKGPMSTGQTPGPASLNTTVVRRNVPAASENRTPVVTKMPSKRFF